MSLSILIPIYNFDVNSLVHDLHVQCESLKIDYEIVLVDDFSRENYHTKNEKLNKLSSVFYERLDKNIGRSKIRNYLIDKAKFENCLLLDCDVAIVSKNFVKNYLEAIDGDCVVVGGHLYQTNPPKEISKILHWKYGTQVECKSLKERLENPYDSFMTNSFLIQKTIFSKVKFDESLVKYGHEDTLFGITLEINKIPIKHIDNPVLHLGIKTAKDFLKGEKEAILNLIYLSEKETLKNKILDKSKLLRFEKQLKYYYFVTSIFFKNKVEKLFLGDNTSLKVLNYWKFKTLHKLRKTGL